MITLKEFMEVVGYRVTEGGEYGWSCYGYNAYYLDSWNGEQDGHSFTIIFDTKTQEVYEVQAHDYTRNRAYRLVNPSFKSAMEAEATERGVDKSEAWEEVHYIDLEVVDDWIQKALAIQDGDDYDTRVQVPLTLDKDQMYELMLMAHQQDITLNELVENILKQEIERIENDQEDLL